MDDAHHLAAPQQHDLHGHDRHGWSSYEYRVAALHNGQSSTSVATLSETASSLPAPFAHGDIGDAATVGLAGSASYDSSTGTYTLKGAGSDIWNTADGFQFAFTTLTGDGSIVTQVTSMANFVNSGKAGIMMRNSLDPSSAYAIAFLTPQGTVNFEERASSGASSASRASQGTFSTPEWLKLTRSGNAFSVFYSANGTSWTQLGSSFTISMGSTIYGGLITSAHSSSQLATATFANTALTEAGNQPPTVSTPAAASQLPAPNAASANLSVLGADDAGESNLTYSWSAIGTPPAPVTFSVNGTNAAKNTVATFSKAGTYTLGVTIADTYGQNVTSSVTMTVNQTLTAIIVSPPTSSLTSGQTEIFAATALDQFNNPMVIAPAFTWSVDPGSVGTVDGSGLYTAPLSPVGSATVRATSGTISGTAAIQVNYLQGDINLDGHRDGADIVAFMQAITDLSGYQTQQVLSNQNLLTIADINGDGEVNNSDLQYLLNLVIGGGSSASAGMAVTQPQGTAADTRYQR